MRPFAPWGKNEYWVLKVAGGHNSKKGHFVGCELLENCRQAYLEQARKREMEESLADQAAVADADDDPMVCVGQRR